MHTMHKKDTEELDSTFTSFLTSAALFMLYNNTFINIDTYLYMLEQKFQTVKAEHCKSILSGASRLFKVRTVFPKD